MKYLSQSQITRTVATLLCIAVLAMPANAATTGASGGGASAGGKSDRGAGNSRGASDRNEVSINSAASKANLSKKAVSVSGQVTSPVSVSPKAANGDVLDLTIDQNPSERKKKVVRVVPLLTDGVPTENPSAN